MALVNLMRDIAVEQMRVTAYGPGSVLTPGDLYDARREANVRQEPYIEGEEEGEDDGFEPIER